MLASFALRFLLFHVFVHDLDESSLGGWVVAIAVRTNSCASDGEWSSPIPRKIHQLWLSRGKRTTSPDLGAEGVEESIIDAEPESRELRDALSTWRREALSLGPCRWEHTVWNRSSARAFLAAVSLLDTFERLAEWPERQKDFFMYVVLSRIGGIFVDADVMPLRPPSAWFEETQALFGGLGASRVRLIVGLEARGSDAEAQAWRWSGRTQLTAWAAAAAPGHPVVTRATDAYVRAPLLASDALSQAQYEHSISLGPGLLTSAVDEWLKELSGSSGLDSLPSVSAGARGSLAGDTVVLGIDGFGCGQPHSGSGPCNVSAALVQHLFAGAWKPVAQYPWMLLGDDFDGSRRRRRSADLVDWRLPAFALMAHARSFNVTLTWDMIKMFFSRMVPIEPPLLPAPKR
eukprot:TRINITY_DN22789_c0_g2_i2.p1 TRINITY_DN22789_c0_g2~~TRINITY_DN22789_c0_g2_i2.p1  ORF type:complete len:403 (+),score=69.79 TRINITY_DN22789_c0_g2_i2:55-1263(+)